MKWYFEMMKWYVVHFPDQATVHLACSLSSLQQGEAIAEGSEFITFEDKDLTGAVVVKVLSEEMVECIFKLTFIMNDLQAIERHIQDAVAFGYQNTDALAICEREKGKGCTAFGVPDFVSVYIEPLLVECVTLGIALRPVLFKPVN